MNYDLAKQKETEFRVMFLTGDTFKNVHETQKPDIADAVTSTYLRLYCVNMDEAELEKTESDYFNKIKAAKSWADLDRVVKEYEDIITDYKSDRILSAEDIGGENWPPAIGDKYINEHGETVVLDSPQTEMIVGAYILTEAGSEKKCDAMSYDILEAVTTEEEKAEFSRIMDEAETYANIELKNSKKLGNDFNNELHTISDPKTAHEARRKMFGIIQKYIENKPEAMRDAFEKFEEETSKIVAECEEEIRAQEGSPVAYSPLSEEEQKTLNDKLAMIKSQYKNKDGESIYEPEAAEFEKKVKATELIKDKDKAEELRSQLFKKCDDIESANKLYWKECAKESQENVRDTKTIDIVMGQDERDRKDAVHKAEKYDVSKASTLIGGFKGLVSFAQNPENIGAFMAAIAEMGINITKLAINFASSHTRVEEQKEIDREPVAKGDAYRANNIREVKAETLQQSKDTLTKELEEQQDKCLNEKNGGFEYNMSMSDGSRNTIGLRPTLDSVTGKREAGFTINGKEAKIEDIIKLCEKEAGNKHANPFNDLYQTIIKGDKSKNEFMIGKEAKSHKAKKETRTGDER